MAPLDGLVPVISKWLAYGEQCNHATEPEADEEAHDNPGSNDHFAVCKDFEIQYQKCHFW